MAQRRFYNKKKSHNSFRPYNSFRNNSNQYIQKRQFNQNEDCKSESHSKWIMKKDKKENESKDKEYYRQKVWNYMENNNIALFPRPCYHRIPNFIGADKAAINLLKLECFTSSKIIKVNPDKPQQYVRYLCLKMDKKLLIPTPRLKTNGLLNEIVIPFHLKNNAKSLEMAATRKGLQRFGHLLSLNQLSKWKNTKIDICIVGSVAVDKTNGYRIGKGEGYADIEIAILNQLGLIDINTKFIATVHDCQVFESLNDQLFDDIDVTLDYIVTPTKIIEINKKNDNEDDDNKTKELPYKINWNKLTQDRINKIPVLKHLRSYQQQNKSNDNGKQSKVHQDKKSKYKSHTVNRW